MIQILNLAGNRRGPNTVFRVLNMQNYFSFTQVWWVASFLFSFNELSKSCQIPWRLFKAMMANTYKYIQKVPVVTTAYFIDFWRQWEREKHWFVPVIYAFIAWFSYVPWLEIEPATLAYQDDALNQLSTWPEPIVTVSKLAEREQKLLAEKACPNSVQFKANSFL